MESHFLNVDLDLRCSAGVEPLLRALGKRIRVMYTEETWASIELRVQPKSADDAIARYAALVRRLSVRGKEAWRRCETRTMNIGVESRSEKEPGVYSLSRATLRLLETLDADMVFTVYRRT